MFIESENVGCDIGTTDYIYSFRLRCNYMGSQTPPARSRFPVSVRTLVKK
jgi:hypothetical protein